MSSRFWALLLLIEAAAILALCLRMAHYGRQVRQDLRTDQALLDTIEHVLKNSARGSGEQRDLPPDIACAFHPTELADHTCRTRSDGLCTERYCCLHGHEPLQVREKNLNRLKSEYRSSDDE